MLRPHFRREAFSVLEDLRSRGIQCGVLSNCLPETVDIWRELPLSSTIDAVSLSPATGFLKPDPAAYLDILARIGVPADKSLFISDGDHAELETAAALGVTAVHFSDNGNILEGFDTISALQDVFMFIG
jgi:putative hydrolase of the HAD superfamily